MISSLLVRFLRTAARPAVFLFAAAVLAPAALAQPGVPGAKPPASWIDPVTGHRVVWLTREPGSASLYFNDNPYTPDGKEMIYTTADGSIGVVRLADFSSRVVVAGPLQCIAVGHKTPTVYYLRATPDPLYGVLWSTNLDTGETRQIATLPRRGKVNTINADETLAAGTYIVGDGADYGGPATIQAHPLDQAVNKGQMMAERLARRLPIEMYTINLQTGQRTVLLKSTDWLNHLQFSPSDPTLLMYCHEGLWWLVDRIWTIRTDGTQNQLIHQRTMQMEIAGHEWWQLNGEAIWYQLHYPPGMRISFVASYNVKTGLRRWYSYGAEAASIHHNVSPDGTLFCGDGGKSAPGIFLFNPHETKDSHTLGRNLIVGGYLTAVKLVDLSKHDYKLEPNPIFTPDQKWIVFRSNMFAGVTYSFAVEVAKSAAGATASLAP